MATLRRGPWSVLMLVALAAILTGCASVRPSLGIRPPEPPVNATSMTACQEYEKYAQYAQGLQEAYHSRASQNRGRLYVAGILGLGVAAATGGLAAATAVGAGTLALVTLSGGFAAGSFATLNNEALALSYTVAANSIDETLKTAREHRRDPQKDQKLTEDSCAAGLSILVAGVSDARTHLEVARTDNAAGALARAQDQLTLLREQIAAVEAADLTRITAAPEITKVEPLKVSSSAGTEVKLTVHANLGGVGTADAKVMLGTTGPVPVQAIGQLSANDPHTHVVTFTVPKGTGPGIYEPELVVKNRARIKSKKGTDTELRVE